MQWDYKARQVWITNFDGITKPDRLQSDTVHVLYENDIFKKSFDITANIK